MPGNLFHIFCLSCFSFRICWIVLQLLLWVQVGMLLYLVTARYSEHTLTTSLTEVKESSMEFPALTVCNNNQYHKSVAEQYDDIARDIRPSSDGEDGLNATEYVEFRRRASAMDYEELLKSASQSLSSFMLLCFFGRKEIPCETVVTMTPTFYGYCYTFNSDEVIKARGGPLFVKRPGNEHGFRLVAFVGHSEHYSNGIGAVTAGVKVSSNLRVHPKYMGRLMPFACLGSNLLLFVLMFQL